MKRKKDDVYRKVIAEIERLGGTVDRERQGNGSHRFVYWSIGGRRYATTVPRDGGNRRLLRNAVGGIRAKAREIEA